ncbi:putative branched-subunit amino acid permease [Sagittula marina]|uniref:Putative branched-subunit amino acid permease n=1 Tax=Sagittula marina TaxID=943940 RepID=A0A7W6DU16_9RHOB|nr:AzlC family ABC transporter permease [Sagittula marina]MBB3986892.1 putative branched-subunit amino acid permease [Sagittula marina]
MPQPNVMSSFWRGVRDGLPFLLVVGPFALLFGVIATEAGLNVFETLSFSVVVIAGAAQFTALQLLSENTPVVVVLASALAVNLRMAMYSASITPHLGALPLWKRMITAYFLVDQTYAAAALNYEKHPNQTLAQKFAYFMGVVLPICPPWYVFTLVGAWLGNAVPEGLGIDFVLPLAFIAMLGPSLRTGAHRVAATVGGVAALVFAFLPYNLGLIAGALLGMMAGAEFERRMLPQEGKS